MSNKVAALSATPDPTPSQQHAPQSHELPGIMPGPLAAQVEQGVIDQADLRLVIEEDAGTYVYKTINRVTGDVVAQYPREDVLKMLEAEDYAAGSVVNAKA
jgi:flagellar protein FlaG